jgi:ribosomal protein S18 acetylase RimI-like enzyme
MSGYQFPKTPKLEEAFRTAYRALTALVPPNAVTAEGESSFAEVLSQFRFLVDGADLAVAAQLGPRISWRAPRLDGDWDLVMAGIDLDDGAHDFGDVVLGSDAFKGPTEVWHGSALDRAGLVYKRACGWDFSPGEAGVWVVMLAPVAASGGEDGFWFYDGHLAGFVVVYNRDEDDDYESIGHIWTATAWKRRGIARRLLAEARSRFPITDVEKPYTDEGAAFLNAFPDPKDTLQS